MLRSIGYWQSLGVQRLPGAVALPDDFPPAALLLPDGPTGQAFLIYANFSVIRRYNPSDYYALATDALGRSPPFSHDQPFHSRSHCRPGQLHPAAAAARPGGRSPLPSATRINSVANGCIRAISTIMTPPASPPSSIRSQASAYTVDNELFAPQALAAASPVLQLPCVVTVTNLVNGELLDVRVNERGPAMPPARVLAVTPRVMAQLLNFPSGGVVEVGVKLNQAAFHAALARAGRWTQAHRRPGGRDHRAGTAPARLAGGSAGAAQQIGPAATDTSPASPSPSRCPAPCRPARRRPARFTCASPASASMRMALSPPSPGCPGCRPMWRRSPPPTACTGR